MSFAKKQKVFNKNEIGRKGLVRIIFIFIPGKCEQKGGVIINTYC